VSGAAWTTLAIVLGAIALFASEKVRIDLVALIVLVLLVVLGLVSPDEALAGFSNEATVTVAAMFALSLGIERSGVLEPLAAVLGRIRKPWLLTLALMLAIAPMGAFIKNIALVATFLPLALRVCARTKTPPGRVLLPTSAVEAVSLTVAGAIVFAIGIRFSGAIGAEEIRLLRRANLPGGRWLLTFLGAPMEAR